MIDSQVGGPATNPLDELDAQERAGVTAIWLVPDSDERPGYLALEMLGGMKPFARVWLNTMTSPEAMDRVDWGHHIADDAVLVWRSTDDG
jgi:hypothetical protein